MTRGERRDKRHNILELEGPSVVAAGGVTAWPLQPKSKGLNPASPAAGCVA